MKRLLLLFFVVVSVPLYAQHLPTGTYQPNRERSYDIVHYKADIQIDWANKKIIGESTIRLRPLSPLSSVTLDAYRLNVSSVREASAMKDLKFSTDATTLGMDFGRTLKETDTTTVVIQYTATPTAGLYFVDEPRGNRMVPTVFSYGEGGIHANWLPIYNDTNDKFSTEMIVTVPKQDVAISNGTLLNTTDNSDGTRTFHWSQSLPHSSYLIALFVGEYVQVKLRPAFGTIPLSGWTPPGTEDQAQYVFGRTPDMIEFFSNQFNYRYPWDKYDQVSSFDYVVGAMENTGITGHNNSILRKPGQTEMFGPDFEYYNSNWTQETLVSHELAHHWFGDNLTCRSLASIWLNESFASYLMMLWDEQRLGKEYLQSQTWLALQQYLAFVRTSHTIRPLEYRYYDTRDQIYNTQTTYQKGGIVLNMLRWVLGDEEFFKAMGYYLNKHEFANVESDNLKTAIEESTGKNLGWFFDQWVYGGGHPVFEVHSQYLPDRKKVELSVSQVQTVVEGQGLFTLPVEIRIDAQGKTMRQIVWVKNENEVFTFDCPAEPSLVSFDGRGALVCDLTFEKGVNELAYQLQKDELPGQLRALYQLVERYAGNPEAMKAIRSTIESNAHWSLRAEATYLLKQVPSPEAEAILLAQLKSDEEHIRKAAVIALGSHFGDASRKALQRVADNDSNDNIAATALVSLAKIGAKPSARYLEQYMNKASWYDVKRIAALKALELIGDPSYLTLVKPNVALKYNSGVRQQALTSWAALAPTDTQLIDQLLVAAKKELLFVRQSVFGVLGKLKITRAVPVLEDIVATDGDSEIRYFAKQALNEIQSMK